jgi:signal transduction histidine kinase
MDSPMNDWPDNQGNDVARLVREQAALRRVATLVARGVSPDVLFTAVSEEVGQLLSVDIAGMGRYGPDGLVVAAVWGRAREGLPAVGSAWPLDGENVPNLVAQTRRSARIDSEAAPTSPLDAVVHRLGIRSSVGAPILVDGMLWGVMVVAATMEQPLPPDTESRVASFTDLVATAIANADSHAALARLAEEQAALRRVATLVARSVAPQEVFEAVTQEVGQLLGVDRVSFSMSRYNSDGTMTVLAVWREPAGLFRPPRTRWALGGNNAPTLVAQTGREARIDRLADDSGPIGQAAREQGYTSQVGTPVLVDGRLWGVTLVGSTMEKPLPASTEVRVAAFTELVAMAIANAESRSELAASRARIVASADEARRRIERDLHDGAQQRLVSLGLQVGAALETASGLGELERELAAIAEGIANVQEGLRLIARGIHPAILGHGGLGPALRTLALGCPIPVELRTRVEDARLPEPVVVAAYYVVSEALANAAKHAQASVVLVQVDVWEGALSVCVSDDGAGGADAARGSGLIGLKDRVETLGGTITVSSPVGVGTTLRASLPLDE